MGFHPQMFKASKTCKSQDKWSSCWRKECLQLVQQEWGCAVTTKMTLDLSRKLIETNSALWDEDDHADHQQHSCITPFNKVLHQVRHPLRTLESMVVQFCQGDDEILNPNATLHPSFVAMANALFGEHVGHDFGDYTCIQGVAHFIVEYNNALLEQQSAAPPGNTANKMTRFQVETTTPCQVLQLAGFLSQETLVYPPHWNQLNQLCNSDDSDSNSNSPLHRPMISTTKDKVNQDGLNLSWEQLDKMELNLPASQKIVPILKQLTIALEYEL